jgi:hypothetical protein
MVKLLQWCVRILGLGALALGTVLWVSPHLIDTFPAGVQVHMTFGGSVALLLAILAVWALVDRVKLPIAITGLVWAVATVYVGTLQDWWINGGSHPAIAIVHLLLGLGAIGLAEMLAAAINRKQALLA